MTWTKISEARKAKGWTQGDLAKKLGVSQQQVARWENSDGDIKASALVNIASALGVTVSYLLGVEVGRDKIAVEDPRTSELAQLFNTMGPEQRDALMLVARALCGSQGARIER